MLHGLIKKHAQAGCLMLSILLAVLAGCVPSGTVKPNPAVPSAPAGGPSAAPLDNGREGFIITEVPDTDESLRRDFEYAVTLIEGQDFKQAAALLEKVIERSPGVTAPYIDLAIVYRHLNQPDKAEAHLKTALRLVPCHPAACNEYGMLCRKAGRFSEAKEIYGRALAKFPDYYPVRKNLGILCDLYLNDLECALEQYELYIAARPEDKQVKLWVADLRNRMGI